jgi:Restriction endonuclease
MLPLLIQGSGFTLPEANAFLDRFTLPIRSAWDQGLPEGCKPEDVYPWRFRRNLSLLMRPLVEVGKSPRTWYVSATLFRTSLGYILDHLERGAFPERFFTSREMRSYIGRVVHRKGHLFAERVSELFTANGFETRLELEMTQLGASRDEGLGDLDVLAWKRTSGAVYSVECKRLLSALNAREVIQRLEDFRGDKKTKDSLGRHLRRIAWLERHLKVVSKLTDIRLGDIHLTALLITSEIVPMQFFEEMHFPVTQVLALDELEELLRSLA